MGATLTKKEMQKQIKELYAKIGDSQDCIKAEFRQYKKVSKAFVKATADYKKAKAAYDKKPKAKNERKLDAALDNFYLANDEYKAVYNVIDSYFNAVEQDYNEVRDLYEECGKSRKAEKSGLEFEKYRDWLEAKLTLLGGDIPELVEDEEEEVEEVVEEEAAPEVPEVAAPVTNISVPSVSINPVVIDVSNTVETVVANAMAKLDNLLTKKLGEYFDGLALPEAGATTTVVKEVVKELQPPYKRKVFGTVISVDIFAVT